MIDQVLTRRNLLQAMRKVQKNHGSAGVDHMPVTQLTELMSIDKTALSGKVRSGKYLPQAILGIEIPKGNGEKRLLGIPTVTDRLLQQAVLQIIHARFEFEFSDSSYGFRPKRSVHQAVVKAQGCINEGFQHIVDIDLKTFFDEVDHRYSITTGLSQSKMSRHLTPYPQMAWCLNINKRAISQTQKRCTTR